MEIVKQKKGFYLLIATITLLFFSVIALMSSSVSAATLDEEHTNEVMELEPLI